MQKSLVDFLNHGTIPFVGRENELQTILSFLGSHDERSGLEVLLLLGEAGVGKSRLIEACLDREESSSTAFLHIKLRPEGSLDFARLITEAIERSSTARALFQNDGEAVTLADAVGRIRRLAALRRTGMIVEDIHLLGGERLNEFLYILDTLRDEPISLVAAARPVELPARGVLEPYLHGEISLPGLRPHALAQLWTIFFDAPLPEQVSNNLVKTTRGNALTLRSALRVGIREGLFSTGYVQPGTLGPQAGSFGQQIPGASASTAGSIPFLDFDAFTEASLRSTHSFAEGILADLEPSLYRAATRLALLGEVFTREAAEIMVEQCDTVLASLMFKGILVRSSTPGVAVNSLERDYGERGVARVVPIAFTHTLLHADLMDRAESSVDDLIRVIGSGAPLLTYYPYSHLVELMKQGGGASSVPVEIIISALERTVEAARQINSTAEWHRAPLMEEVADLLYGLLEGVVPTEELDKIESGILLMKLETTFRQRNSSMLDRQLSLALRLCELTEGKTSPTMLQRAIKGMMFLIRNAEERKQPEEGKRLRTRVFALIDQHPDIRATKDYSTLVHLISNYAINRGEDALLLDMKERVERDLADPTLPPLFRRSLRNLLIPHFLGLYNTREELEQNIRLVEEIRRDFVPVELVYQTSQLPSYAYILSFFYNAGMLREARQLAGPIMVKARHFSLDATVVVSIRTEMVGYGLMEDDHESLRTAILGSIEKINQLFPPEVDPEQLFFIRIVRSVALISMLRGEPALLRWTLEQTGVEESRIFSGERLGYVLQEKRFEDLRPIVDTFPDALRVLGLIALEPPEDEEKVVAAYIDQFNHIEFTLVAMVRYISAFHLVQRGLEIGSIRMTPELKKSMNRALVHMLTFYDERNLPLCMRPLLREHGAFLSERERRTWGRRLDELMGGRKRDLEGEMKVTLFDAIGITMEDGEEVRIRGGRSRQLLGLLVAMQIVRRPIDRPEFFRLASGVEDDPDRARTSTNVAVSRLREVIGKDGVQSGEDLPTLNLDMVQVDLLDLWNGLKSVEEHLMRGRLIGAREGMMEAIRTGAGRVPFPGLYDPLFEGLRDDIENRLRSLLLQTTRKLMGSDDMIGAEELLQLWCERIPEDEEARGLLAETLRKQGREGEAALTTPD